MQDDKAGSDTTVPQTPEEIIALAIWREREIGFPPRVRRFNPDAIDRESGAWRAVEREARRAIGALYAAGYQILPSGVVQE